MLMYFPFGSWQQDCPPTTSMLWLKYVRSRVNSGSGMVPPND